jgi:hypothetical protein
MDPDGDILAGFIGETNSEGYETASANDPAELSSDSALHAGLPYLINTYHASGRVNPRSKQGKALRFGFGGGPLALQLELHYGS